MVSCRRHAYCICMYLSCASGYVTDNLKELTCLWMSWQYWLSHCFHTAINKLCVKYMVKQPKWVNASVFYMHRICYLWLAMTITTQMTLANSPHQSITTAQVRPLNSFYNVTPTFDMNRQVQTLFSHAMMVQEWCTATKMFWIKHVVQSVPWLATSINLYKIPMDPERGRGMKRSKEYFLNLQTLQSTGTRVSVYQSRLCPKRGLNPHHQGIKNNFVMIKIMQSNWLQHSDSALTSHSWTSYQHVKWPCETFVHHLGLHCLALVGTTMQI